MKTFGLVLLLFVLLQAGYARAEKNTAPAWLPTTASAVEAKWIAQHGTQQQARLHRGLAQVAALWREGDGDANAFAQFVNTQFAPDDATLDTMFDRYERNFEALDGHLQELGRLLRQQADLDRGALLPMDETFAAYEAGAHVSDDLFANKLAFAVLLNFPLTTLEQRAAEGPRWTRRQWAEARLAQRFDRRIPADVTLAIGQAQSGAQNYIAGYNIWMHHLLDGEGKRLFPPKMRLLSHWNLRDEIKADYSDTASGLAKQRLITQVMERIVTQTLPAAVIDNPRVDWNPVSNEVRNAQVRDDDAGGSAAGASAPAPDKAPEPDTRYARLLANFQAERRADPYSPSAPTFIARRFSDDYELPEARVRSMLQALASSDVVPRVARLIAGRLGRPLEPFDVWYNGFRPREAYTEAQLDEMVRRKYPTPQAYEKDMPNLLVKLGFTPERAQYIARNIVVDPARGSGHAMGAAMRDAKVHLRTRVGKDGMDYKGYNIAVHEMGHNVEQTFSLNLVDHTLLAGVPNNAFTEALAFVFQNRDLELLGLSKPDAKSAAMKTLNDFWGAYEIAGVGLVDLEVWHWLYDHPAATAGELKAATVASAKRIWNAYYAPVFGKRDVVLLGVYSHMINYSLYLANYPLGHMIAFQIEQQMEQAGNPGAEFERMARQGKLSPDLWMQQATGAPVGPDALLAATRNALAQLSPD